MATATKNARSLVASASNAAGATTRGTLDLRTAFGGYLTIRVTNGSTGPTAQCEARVLVSHNAGSTPTAASQGADWKQIYVVGGGTTNSAVTEFGMDVDPAIMHLEVEFTGNTAQAVKVEAYFSELTSVG